MEDDDDDFGNSGPTVSSSSILNPQAGAFLPTTTASHRPDPQSAPYNSLDPASHAFQPGSSFEAGCDVYGPEEWNSRSGEDEGAQVEASTDYYSRQSEIVQEYETTEEDSWEAESYIDPQDDRVWQRVAGEDGLWESIRRCPNPECARGFHFMWQTYDEKYDKLMFEEERCSVEGRDAKERKKIQRNTYERKRRIEAFRARRQAGSEEAKKRYPVSRDLPAFLKTHPLRNSALRKEVVVVAPPKEDSFAYGLPRGLRPGQSWADDDDDDDEDNDDDYDGGDENDKYDDENDVDDSEVEMDSGFWPVAKTTAARPSVERSEEGAKEKAEYVEADGSLLTRAERSENESVGPPDQKITPMASGEASLSAEEATAGASRPGERRDVQYSEAASQGVSSDSRANIYTESSSEFGAASDYESQKQTSPQLTSASGVEGVTEFTPSIFTTGQQGQSSPLQASPAATMDTPSDSSPQGQKDWKTLYELARQDIHRFLSIQFNTTHMAEANTKLEAERAELKAFLRDDFDSDTIADAREQLAGERSEKDDFLAHFRTDNFEEASRSLLNMIEHIKILKETNELLEDATKKTEIAEHKVRSLERENERLKLAQQNTTQEASRGRSPTRQNVEDSSEEAARDRDLSVTVDLALIPTAEIFERMKKRFARLHSNLNKWKAHSEENQRRIQQIRERTRAMHETTKDVVQSFTEHKEEVGGLLQGAKESISEVKEILEASDQVRRRHEEVLRLGRVHRRKQNELYETRAGKSDKELKAELEAVCEEYKLNVDKVMATSETYQWDSDSDESSFVDAAEVADETD